MVGPRRVGPRRVGAKPRKSEGPKLWGPEGGAPKGGAPKGGAPKGGAPKGGGRTVGAQNFALFFPSPATVFIFSLSFGLFRGILVVFEAPGPSNVRVWSSRVVVCEPRRPGLVGPPGFHTTTREPKRAHLSVPVFKNTTKIQRKRPKERGKRINTVAGEGKKERNFGRSGGGGSDGGGSGGGALNTHHTHTTTTQNNTLQQHRTSKK